MSTVKTMHEAFLHELSDTYSAEHQLTDAMEGMLELTQYPAIKSGLQQHIKETKQQIKNLDRIFASMGEKPEDVTCKGIAGIVSEFKSGSKEIKEPALLEGFIAAGGLKSEHYEIATYRCLVQKAQAMGHADAASLLTENLQMEERFAEKLEEVDQQLGQEIVRTMPELVGHPASEGAARKSAR